MCVNGSLGLNAAARKIEKAAPAAPRSESKHKRAERIIEESGEKFASVRAVQKKILTLPHEEEAEFFITEQRGKRAGESPTPCGSVDLIVVIVRTAGDAVETHASASPTRAALAERCVSRGVRPNAQDTRVRQATRVDFCGS